MNVQCHRNSVNLDAVNFDTLYLVKLIFGKYFCYFDTNHVADLLHLDAIRVPVHERVNRVFPSSSTELLMVPMPGLGQNLVYVNLTEVVH